MNDQFRRYTEGLESPATAGMEITPSDTADLTTVPRCLFINEAGTLSVTMRDGGTVMLNVNPGSFLPIRPIRVHATGTTANGIIGFW